MLKQQQQQQKNQKQTKPDLHLGSKSKKLIIYLGKIKPSYTYYENCIRNEIRVPYTFS